MKNLGVFYMLAFLPFVFILAYAFVFGKHNIGLMLLLYLVYRQVIDTMRLVAIGSIPRDKVWTAIIPFYLHTAYFKDLYFKA